MRWANYKALLKAYIFRHSNRVPHTKRLAYFSHKRKEGSLRHQPSNHFAMDDQFNMITFGGYSISEASLKAAYGDTLQGFLKESGAASASSVAHTFTID